MDLKKVSTEFSLSLQPHYKVNLETCQGRQIINISIGIFMWFHMNSSDYIKKYDIILSVNCKEIGTYKEKELIFRLKYYIFIFHFTKK